MDLKSERSELHLATQVGRSAHALTCHSSPKQVLVVSHLRSGRALSRGRQGIPGMGTDAFDLHGMTGMILGPCVFQVLSHMSSLALPPLGNSLEPLCCPYHADEEKGRFVTQPRCPNLPWPLRWEPCVFLPYYHSSLTLPLPNRGPGVQSS